MRVGSSWGVVGAAVLAASGAAGVVKPDVFGAALDLPPTTGRGRAEIRAGLGATYTALATWALARRSPDAAAAVGFTWLGAGVTRLVTLRLDRPRTDAVFWGSLAAELGLGATSVAAALGARS